MKECRFPGCERPAKIKGLCSAHYTQKHRGQELRPLKIPIKNQGEICSEEGCSNPAQGLGLCSLHYQRVLRKRRKESGIACSFNGCERPIDHRGLCRGHYDQLLKGKQLTPIAEMESNIGKTCRVPECTKPATAKGLCSTHHNQLMSGKELMPLKNQTKNKGEECKFPGCTKEAKVFGYCGSHDWQIKNKGTLSPLYERRNKEPNCLECGASFDDVVYGGNGLCKKCYMDKWREENKEHIIEYEIELYGKLTKEEKLSRADYRKKMYIIKYVNKDYFIEKTNGICELCGEEIDCSNFNDVHLDHILAKTIGGNDELINLRLVHPFCNISKNNNIHNKDKEFIKNNLNLLIKKDINEETLKKIKKTLDL